LTAAVRLQKRPLRDFDRLADLGSDILDETGKSVQAIPYRAGAYDDRTSLMPEIRYEGVDPSR
jgi:hypothetical protein